MNKNWFGIMKVLSFELKNKKGKILYREENVYNMLHKEGEQFILSTCFAGTALPTSYYFGMDNRFITTVGDSMSSFNDNQYEPSGFGYLRQQIPSSGANSFTLVFEGSNYRAVSPPIQFSAINGSWGPIKNIFLTNKSDITGFLISSASLQNSIIVENGQSITMRMAMALRDCPT